MSSSYYNKNKAPGQVKGIQTSLFTGLNEFDSPNSISENAISEMWEAQPGGSDAIILGSRSANVLLGSNLTGSGMIICGISDRTSDAHDHVILMTADGQAGADAYLNDFTDINITDNTKTVIDIASKALPWSGIHSMCIFFTEATRFVMFTTSLAKKLLYYDYSATPATVDLPFYPKKIISHVNRIFAIDTTNKLWWCRGGDFHTWYGLEEDTNYIVESVDMKDSGTYTIAHQPDVCRVLTCTVTATSTADTMGTITIVGTDIFDAAQTEVFIPVIGKQVLFKAFKTITSITAAGHTAVAGADKIIIGVGAVGSGYVQQDAGYWTLENERILMNMAVLGNNLYIWSDVNIYVFQGYSYDTFALSKIISGIGSKDDVTVSNNTAYFMFGNEIYEFNGESTPRVINRPVLSNGAIINGMYGGIGTSITNSSSALTTYDTYAKLASDNDYVYVYYQALGWVDGIIRQMRFYMYDIKARSWWLRNGFARSHNPATDALRALYLPQPDRKGFYNICNSYHGTDNPTWYIYSYPGNTLSGNSHIVTKAFSEGISDTGTLTNLILMLRSFDVPFTDPTLDELNIYYSLSVDADDWILLKTFEGYEIPYDLDNLTINLAGSEINKAHHYRLKIEFVSTSDEIYLYGIERRYRILGRSR